VLCIRSWQFAVWLILTCSFSFWDFIFTELLDLVTWPLHASSLFNDKFVSNQPITKHVALTSSPRNGHCFVNWDVTVMSHQCCTAKLIVSCPIEHWKKNIDILYFLGIHPNSWGGAVIVTCLDIYWFNTNSLLNWQTIKKAIHRFTAALRVVPVSDPGERCRGCAPPCRLFLSCIFKKIVWIFGVYVVHPVLKMVHPPPPLRTIINLPSLSSVKKWQFIEFRNAHNKYCWFTPDFWSSSMNVFAVIYFRENVLHMAHFKILHIRPA